MHSAAFASPHRFRLAAPTRPRRMAVSTYARRYGFHPGARTRFLGASLPHTRWRAAAVRPHRSYAWTQRRFVRFATARPVMQPESVSGTGSNVIADALRFVGSGNVTGTRGPWCADYASMILRRTGHRPLANRSVSSAFAYGPRVHQPKPGDLVVLNTRAGYAQHVGFFAGWAHGFMMMVSGNWGHRVSVAPVSPRSVAAFIGV